MPVEYVDQLILGGGIFGLHAADRASSRGLTVAVVDPERAPMMRASFANQARIHLGYHYPRSIGTAVQAIEYHDRFVHDFAAAVNDRFTKVYAVARTESLTSALGFEQFCDRVGIPADRVDPDQWFRPGVVEAAYRTTETSFDAPTVRRLLLERLAGRPNVTWHLRARPVRAIERAQGFEVELSDGTVVDSPRVLNATYSAANQVLSLFGFDPLPVTYELCELALGHVSPDLAAVGLTVMDGPFFSVMPFGLSGLHSLSAVDYTPHHRSAGPLPEFPCQHQSPTCSPTNLDNCGTCPVRPVTNVASMTQLADRFLNDSLTFTPEQSILAVRPVLRISNVDDSRPTLLYRHNREPELVTVLSGKINTIYDLDDLW